MWEVPLGSQQSENVVNNIMEQTRKTRTILVFTCSTFQPNYNKCPQGNQTIFPEDVDVPNRKTHQETPWEIK